MTDRSNAAVLVLPQAGTVGARKILPMLLWVAALAIPTFAPGYTPLASQIVVMILFALSLDLLVGFTGIVTLGHAALFGAGAYTAGIMALRLTNDPLITALSGMAVAALVGLVTGSCMLRTKGLAFLVLSLAAAFMLHELANMATSVTGGDDGLQGVSFAPLLGVFEFDFRGQTAFYYSLACLFAAFLLVRRVVNSPFGWSLRGIRENDGRMRAIGCPIYRRRLAAYVISSALAGLAGALQAQITQFVALRSLSLELSGDVLIMLILGGAGRLYGAFVGVPLFMFAQDLLAKEDPANWYLGQGVILLVMTLFVPGGVLGLVERVRRSLGRGGRR
ncbi:branched-chain amino acid ABC transporter permease [Magnetospirillum sp. SS-4]|uniref:branched-chain amino acid ABC transporter permease n=1 Tax=Magnetospirillum sp. SS-4 TaxID=2681465 RepID=UPI0013831DA1|nr:branched-chain amino acid ABC transporter permease [Magnetospirillum sp. SS-4]CAA7625008.1 Branched-chain amino acid ABC transporter permease [Magnetospirillum sp. SS-4]